IQQAAFSDHLWKRDTRHQRAVRERHLLQRVLEPAGEVVILGTLRDAELKMLRDGLLEMRDSAARYWDELLRLQASLVDTQHTMQSLNGLRNALQTFLFAKPPTFPSVEEVCLSDEHQRTAREEYESWLRWFSMEEGDHAEKFISEARE